MCNTNHKHQKISRRFVFIALDNAFNKRMTYIRIKSTILKIDVKLFNSNNEMYVRFEELLHYHIKSTRTVYVKSVTYANGKSVRYLNSKEKQMFTFEKRIPPSRLRAIRVYETFNCIKRKVLDLVMFISTTPTLDSVTPWQSETAK